MQQSKSKAQRYAQRPEREQTFFDFMATVSDDDDGEEYVDTGDELAEQVEAPEVDADRGPRPMSNHNFSVS